MALCHDAGFTFPFRPDDLGPGNHDAAMANGPLAPQQTYR
jgi:hypothetical protein